MVTHCPYLLLLDAQTCVGFLGFSFGVFFPAAETTVASKSILLLLFAMTLCSPVSLRGTWFAKTKSLPLKEALCLLKREGLPQGAVGPKGNRAGNVYREFIFGPSFSSAGSPQGSVGVSPWCAVRSGGRCAARSPGRRGRCGPRGSARAGLREAPARGGRLARAAQSPPPPDHLHNAFLLVQRRRGGARWSREGSAAPAAPPGTGPGSGPLHGAPGHGAGVSVQGRDWSSIVLVGPFRPRRSCGSMWVNTGVFLAELLTHRGNTPLPIFAHCFILCGHCSMALPKGALYQCP